MTGTADITNKLVPWHGDSHVPVGSKRIARLEAAYGPLPESYKRFLSTYGASAFAGLAIVQANRSEYPLAGLFGSGASTESVISRNFARRDEGMPPGAIAIGADHSGGLFLLRQRDGAILHWETESDPLEVPDAVQVVAPSFEALLDQIVVEE